MAQEKRPEAPRLNLSDSETRELGEVRERYRDAKDYFTANYFKKFDKLQRLKYKFLEGDPRHDDTERHRINIPLAFANIETVKPLIIGQSPVFGVSLRGVEDEGFSQANAKLFEYQWDAARGQLKIADGIEDNLVYGTNIFQVPWERRFRRVKQVVPVSVPLRVMQQLFRVPVMAREEDVRVATFEGPNLRSISLFEFFPDRYSKEINGDTPAMYLCHEEWLTEEDVKTFFRNGVWHDHEQYALSLAPYSMAESLQEQIRGTQDLEQRESSNIKGGMHCAVHYWTIEDESIIYKVMLDEKVLVRNGDSPLRHGRYPYIRMVDYPRPRDFYGIGECEIVEHMQYLFNDIYNSRVDAALLGMNPMWLTQRNNFDDSIDHFEASPGALYEAVDPSKLQAFPTPDVTAVGYREEEALHRLFSLVSGVSALLKLPESAPVQRSATGAEIVQRISNIRMQSKLQSFDFSGIREIGYQWFLLNNDKLTKTDVQRIVGEELGAKWHNVPFEDGREVPLDIKIQLGSEAPLVRETHRQELLTFAQVAASNPSIDQTYIQAGVWPLVAEKLTENFGLQEATELVKSFRRQQAAAPPEAPPMIPPGGEAEMAPPEMGGMLPPAA